MYKIFIHMNIFDPKSIAHAKKLLEIYKTQLNDRFNKAIEELAELGAETARETLRMGVTEWATGELESTITHIVDPSKNLAVVRVDSEYAIFAEFGTGIIGAGNDHPNPADGWVYDVNNHGEDGWTYFDDREQRKRWTRGQLPKAFMWSAWLEIEDKASGLNR